MNKGWARLERDREVVRKLHDLGILVHASMIFGINPESIETVRETLQRLEEWQVDEMSLFLFTPGPGTRVWERLVESGSEFSRDWRRYNGNHAVIAPEGMGLEELEELYWKLYQGFYKPRSIARRYFRIPRSVRTWAMGLFHNSMILRLDVNRRRADMSNFWDPRELWPGFNSGR